MYLSIYLFIYLSIYLFTLLLIISLFQTKKFTYVPIDGGDAGSWPPQLDTPKHFAPPPIEARGVGPPLCHPRALELNVHAPPPALRPRLRQIIMLF